MTKKQIGSEKKMDIFRCIAKRITSNKENVVWVVGGPGVVSQKIKKNTLTVEAETWWTQA